MRSKKLAAAHTTVAVIALCGLTLAACGETPTTSQGEGEPDFPTKSIQLFLGYDTGGSADPLAREFARLLSEELGVNVTVQNRPGGSGAVATTEVLSSSPDGYTIAVAPASQLTVTPAISNESLSYSGPDDWTTIGGLVEQQNGLMVRSDLGWNTLEDFIAAARANPGELAVGVSSATGANAMGMASLMEVANFKVKLVPFEGGAGEAVAALLGGHIDAMNGTLSGQLGLLQSGELISLGHSGTRPYEPAPSKTFAEQGYPITSLAETKYYVYGPKGIPAEILKILSEAHQRAVNSDEFREWVEMNSYAPYFVGPEEAERDLRKAAEDAKEGVRLLTEAGLDVG